jgi:hypothetical protein
MNYVTLKAKKEVLRQHPQGHAEEILEIISCWPSRVPQIFRNDGIVTSSAEVKWSVAAFGRIKHYVDVRENGTLRRRSRE